MKTWANFFQINFFSRFIKFRRFVPFFTFFLNPRSLQLICLHNRVVALKFSSCRFALSPIHKPRYIQKKNPQQNLQSTWKRQFSLFFSLFSFLTVTFWIRAIKHRNENSGDADVADGGVCSRLAFFRISAFSFFGKFLLFYASRDLFGF